jgi:DNA-binding NtrC family response regulator
VETEPKKLLVVEDNAIVAWSLQEALGALGHQVVVAATGTDGLEAFRSVRPDLVMLDIKLPGMTGMELLRAIKAEEPDQLVIMMTAFGDVATAVQAMRLGAFDFLGKPFELDAVRETVANALACCGPGKGCLQESLAVDTKLSDMVGVSAAAREARDLLRTVAANDNITILLRGESGTGKDLSARIIHNLSRRCRMPFVEINCPTLAPNLFESELFGHERGAFTDAKQFKKGLIEEAHGGTAYFNEIGDLKLDMQVKLLKLLETKTFIRVGGNREIKADARIIASTNRNLWAAVQRGDFREDLYYRLKVIPIYIASLRDRADDVVPLAEHFIRRYNREMNKRVRGVAPRALEALKAYPWPGNVRELKNAVKRAMVFVQGDLIAEEHLPRELFTYVAAPPAGDAGASPGNGRGNGLHVPASGLSLEDVEKDLLRKALQRSGGNQSRAAGLLNITRDTLRYRLKKYGISAEADGENA